MRLNWRGLSASFGVLLVLGTFPAVGTVRAQTDTSASAFINGQNYNQLISDADFSNVNSMSVADIQSFLVAQGSDLATISSSLLGSGANGRSAAQIIYDGEHANDPASSGCAQGICLDPSTGTISAKAILITLQKEEGLITGWKYDSTQTSRLTSAMGYGCPDGSGCNPTYAGFANQVGWGAWQLRWNYEMSKAGNSGVAPYIVGGTLPNMTYNVPDQNLSGSVTVFLSNNATASLYRYTPHLFYGNYNFWKLGITWFGFGTSGGGGGGGSNDTSTLSVGTYGSSFKTTSTKSSNSKVIFNGQTVADFNSTSWTLTISPPIGTNTFVVSYLNTDGSSAGTKSITIERRRVGDINGDGKVNALDLSLLFTNWGQTVRGDSWVNLNPDVDNTINILDMSLMFNNWTG